MITYGTKEEYGDFDWQFGATLTVDDVPRANGINLLIQYNQNEFKKGSYYCTAYMCFTVYSAFTGNRVSEDQRKEFIDICLKEELIIEGEGGYLHKVFHRWINYLEEKLNVAYNYLRVEMGSEDAEKLKEKGYAIGTGFKVSAKFNQDKNDNCVVDKVESVEGTSGEGHALGDYRIAGTVVKHMRMDNYNGVNNCNTYQIVPYDEFVTNEKIHFKYGYILTSLQPAKMSQAEQDQKDLEEAIVEGITNGKELERPATRREVILMIQRALRKKSEE